MFFNTNLGLSFDVGVATGSGFAGSVLPAFKEFLVVLPFFTGSAGAAGNTGSELCGTGLFLKLYPSGSFGFGCGFG